MSTLASVVIRDLFANLPAAGIAGRLFYAKDTGVTYRDNGISWDVYGQFYGTGLSGGRPTVDSTVTGITYLDLSLNKPIWWNGLNWIDATGASV